MQGLFVVSKHFGMFGGLVMGIARVAFFGTITEPSLETDHFLYTVTIGLVGIAAACVAGVP